MVRRAHRIKRTVRSMLAAETMAALGSSRGRRLGWSTSFGDDVVEECEGEDERSEDDAHDVLQFALRLAPQAQNLPTER